MATRRKKRAVRVRARQSRERGASHAWLPPHVQRILEKRRLRGPNSLTVKEEVELFHFYQLDHDPAREPRLSSASRSALRSSQFALPEARALPIHDAAHARNAAARLEQMRLGESLTRAEYNEARKRILRAEKRFGIRSGSTRDFDRPTAHRLPHGFTLLQVPPGFEREHWELRDAGGRLIAEGGEVDWEDTRRAAANALHRYLQRTERDAQRDAVDFWNESPLTIEQLYDSGYIDSREVREWVRRTAQTRGLIYEPISRLSRGGERLRLRLVKT